MAPHAVPISDAEVPVMTPVFEHVSVNPKAAVMNGVHEVDAEQLSPEAPKAPTKSYDIPWLDRLAYTPRKLRIVTVGAGFSGLMIAYKFQHRYPELQEFVDHTIYEMRHDLGGTWLVNTYPGVQCDVPSHIYAFPFDPNPEWNSFYSSGQEILAYIKRTAKKWDLDRDVQLNTKVTSAVWQEDQGKWKITVESGGHSREEFADVLISGQGVLQYVLN
jgi:cation diffusion facilitator CzcD-associated flavoprotein CzcO